MLAPPAAAELPTEVVRSNGAVRASGFDGVVEAVRHAVLAAQVPGSIVRLEVKAGDRVTAGQPLLHLDARAAEQTAAASTAQASAARAALDAATADVERQRALFRQQFISRAALDRAESDFRARSAEAQAQLALADAARTRSGLHVVRAPFAGVVAEVPIALGDMALPGKPLLTVYDPAALRLTATVPQSLSGRAVDAAAVRAELPALPADRTRVTPSRVQWMPTADPRTHTVALRADLPAGLAGVVPGMFGRLWLPTDAGMAGAAANPSVPQQAIVRRAEMTGLYVLDASGRPLLRQVRLGRRDGDRVEVLAGLAVGERVVIDPQAAARRP